MMNESNSGTDILLTGATGFLGGEILARLLESPARVNCRSASSRRDATRGPEPTPIGKVHLLLRADDAGGAERRARELLISLFGRAEPYLDRVVAIAADITRPGLGLDPDQRQSLARSVGRIIHCAASVSFASNLAESRAINVEGTRRMLDLAELANDRGGIDSFVYISTAYVGGCHRGSFAETDLDRGQGFRNPYEQSKLEAETLVQQRAERTRAQVLRPSIVVGDSRSGWTRSFNVIYSPLGAYCRGSLSILPANRSSPVDVVPVDYVADATVALAGRPGTTYNLVAGSQCASVDEIVTQAADAVGRPPPRFVSPAIYRRIIHPLMLRRAGARRRRALRAGEVFFPYYSMALHFDDSEARAALTPLGIEVPALRSYLPRLLDFADAASWGRSPIARHTVVDPVPG